MQTDQSYVYFHIYPNGKSMGYEAASAIHSIAAALDLSWPDAYEQLIQAAGRLGLMPAYSGTVREMLRGCGFFRQTVRRKNVSDLIAAGNAGEYADGMLIVRTSSGFAPIVPADGQYVLRHDRDLRAEHVSELWVRWPDGVNHGTAYREKPQRDHRASGSRTAENAALVVKNENPIDNNIGDCAVRGIAGVLGISWEEAVRKLAGAQDFSEIIINRQDNIDALLRKEGFEKFGAMQKNGRILTGAQFCALIHDMFQAGTRIFAYVGNSHVVAILVFDGEYKIVDTWDSTNCRITGYWAKFPPRSGRRPRNNQPETLSAVEPGLRVRHRAYGIGTVISADGQNAVLRFADGTEKTFGTAWILANCKPAPAE